MPEPPVHDGEIVPFGKYKGQPAEVLFADRGYREWILAQPWVKDRFPTFHQVIINYGGEPQDSPEHNQMQAAFLDDERCDRLARLLWPRRVWEAKQAVRVDRAVVELVARYPQHVAVAWDDPEIFGRRFEADGWDVVFGYTSPQAEVCMLTESPIPCTCPPCDHAGCPQPREWHTFLRAAGQLTCAHCPGAWNSESHHPARCEHERHEAERARQRAEWCDPAGKPSYLVPWAHCGDGCPYADIWLCSWLNAGEERGHWYSAHWDGLVRLECKPDLGDDFPTVLRQVLRYPHDRLDRCCVLVRRHRFQHVTWAQVVDMFAASNIRLIQESELDPVHAVQAR